MSFTASTQGTIFEPGWFLANDEQCTRESATVPQQHAQKVTRNGRDIVPMGAVIPANDATAVGILYEDIDVTDGAVPGSVVTKGTVYGDRLPQRLAEAAATKLADITVKDSPAITRPDFG